MTIYMVHKSYLSEYRYLNKYILFQYDEGFKKTTIQDIAKYIYLSNSIMTIYMVHINYLSRYRYLNKYNLFQYDEGF